MDKPGLEDSSDRELENGIFSGARDAGGSIRQPAGRQTAGQQFTGQPVARQRSAQQTVRTPVPPRGYNSCNYCANRCRTCVHNPNNGKAETTALIIVAVASTIVLLIAFLATIFCLLGVIIWQGKQVTSPTASEYYGSVQPPVLKGADIPEGQAEPQKPQPKSKLSGEYYGELKDEIRTDLPYSIEWKNYEYAGNNDKIAISVDYPVIKGDIPNIDILNGIIEEETVYFEEYFQEYSQYMMANEIFSVYAEGCVTYMDEERMSIVFNETIYTDYWVDNGLFCINIDMKNGVVIDNSSILNFDNEFAVDFRTRSKEQNGSIEAIDYMTDQEIARCLSSKGTSIVFYTPLGMEVGINYGESYVTVTYKDYEKYLLKY